MENAKRHARFWVTVWFLMGATMIFGVFMMLTISGDYLSAEQYTVRDIITHYVNSDPEVTIQQEVTKIPIQKNLDIPGLFDLSSPDTLILMDNSGSMKESVTSFYKENLEFFQQGHDVWFFNTQIEQNADINNITFGGDTNVLMAINTAYLSGYKNILIFSDMEQTIKEARLDVGDDSNLQVYILSPTEITDFSAIEQMQNCTGIKSIKLMQID